MTIDVCPVEIDYAPVYLSGGMVCDGTEEHLSDCDISNEGNCGERIEGCEITTPVDEFQFNVVGLFCSSKFQFATHYYSRRLAFPGKRKAWGN